MCSWKLLSILLCMVMVEAAQKEPLFQELPLVGEPCACVPSATFQESAEEEYTVANMTVDAGAPMATAASTDEVTEAGEGSGIEPERQTETGTLDCSGRGLTNLSPEETMLPTCLTPRAINISHNSLLAFPDGLSWALAVDASRNRLEKLPDAHQLHASLEELDLSWNHVFSTDDELRELISLRVLRVAHNELDSLRFLPRRCALRFFDAAFNDVQQLEVPLTQCTHLQYLDLSYNRIKTLQRDSFFALRELRALDLSRNGVAPLPDGVFAPLENLEQLYLNDTHLENVTEGMFASLSRLRHLSVSRNSLTLPGLHPRSLQPLVALTHLSVAHNDLRGLPLEALAPVADNLEELDVSGSGLTSLPPLAFAAFPRLRRLALTHNALHALPADVFGEEGLSRLTALLLRGNLLSMLPEGALVQLPALVSLDLSFNAWEALPMDVVAQAPALRVAYFAGCKIRNIEEPLPSAGRVRSLGLQDNGLRSVVGSTFSAWPQLLWLRLDRNALSSLPEELLSPLSQLQRLDLSRNALTELPARLLHPTPLLQRLSLARNRLLFLPAVIFAGLSRLERLDLSGNRLRALPPAFCAPMHALRELDLSSNALMTLPAAGSGCVGTGARLLEWTSLERNNIAAPDADALRAWLRALPNATVEGRYVKRLSVEGNPLRPAMMEWLLREPQVSIWVEPSRCGCGVVRSATAAVRFCVESPAPATDEEAECDWKVLAARAAAHAAARAPLVRKAGRRRHRRLRAAAFPPAA